MAGRQAVLGAGRGRGPDEYDGGPRPETGIGVEPKIRGVSEGPSGPRGGIPPDAEGRPAARLGQGPADLSGGPEGRGGPGLVEQDAGGDRQARSVSGGRLGGAGAVGGEPGAGRRG